MAFEPNFRHREGLYETGYHNLDHLFPSQWDPPDSNTFSNLHLLYPGRYMMPTDGFDRYLIPHEYPIEAKEAFCNRRMETEQYAEGLEFTALMDGGGDGQKMTTHFVDDPSAVIEDPDLKNAPMMQPPTFNDADTHLEKPYIDSNHDKGHRHHEQKHHREGHHQEHTGDHHREGDHREHTGGCHREHFQGENQRESFQPQPSGPPDWMWIGLVALIVFGLLILAFAIKKNIDIDH